MAEKTKSSNAMTNFYNREPQPVCESTDNKLVWDFKIQTDKKIEHNKPEIVLLDKIR